MINKLVNSRPRRTSVISASVLAMLSVAAPLRTLADEPIPTVPTQPVTGSCSSVGKIFYNGTCISGDEARAMLERWTGYQRVDGGAGGRGKSPGHKSQPTQDKREAGCPERVGNPVILATGNKVEPELDFATAGEMGLFLERTYNHYWSATGIFGNHWLSNFDYTLVFDSGIAWAQRPDGRRIKFVYDAASNRWSEDKASPVAYIQKGADGVYTLFNEDRGIERYNLDGYIIQRSNEQGISWTFTYAGKFLQRVEHTSGRAIQFVWNGNQLEKVVDPASNAYHFTYTSDVFGSGRHRLASAVLPGAPTTTVTYHYEDGRFPGGLTGKSYNGVRYSTFAYDDQGRAIRTEHAGGADIVGLAYVVETAEQLTAPPPPPPPGGFADGGGGSGWCEFKSGSGMICYEPQVVGDPVALVSFTGSDDGTADSATASATSSSSTTVDIPVRMRVTETNPLGRVTVHHYENGRKVRVEGLQSPSCPGAASSTTYDVNGYESEVVDFVGNRTRYEHDAHVHVTKQVEGVGTAQERATTYVWDETQNRLLSSTVAGYQRISYVYGADGRLKSVTEFNLHPTKGVTNQQRTTSYSYSFHSNGMLASLTVDGPIANSVDAVISTFSPSGDLLSTRNGMGQAVTYSGHNALGAPGRVVGINGETSDYVYDGRGRVTASKAVVNGIPQTTTYSYNSVGKLAAVSTPDGRTRHFVYDAALRLIEEYEREPEGTYARKLTVYNAASLPTKVEIHRSSYPHDTRVIGYVDGVDSSNNVTGWACSTGQNASVDVHLYAGAGWPSGTFVGAFQANRSSEPAVAVACGAEGTAYRFQIGLSDSVRDLHGGRGIYIHGISPAGKDNSLIERSGTWSIPRLVPNAAPAGLTAPSEVAAGSYTVSWSALSRATTYRLEESFNGGAWSVVHDAATTSKAISGKSTGTYRYRVTGCNESGCGPTSGEISVLEIDAPATAPGLSAPAVNTSGNYTVSWTGVSGATGYKLEESANGGTWALVHDGAGGGKAFSAKNISIPHSYRIRACNTAGCGPYSATSTVQQVIYGAEYVWQSVPTLMVGGSTYSVTVQMRNTGNFAWSSAEAFSLGSQNPGDNTRWGLHRVAVPGSVAPGATATFTFNVVAPSAAGAYSFQWRMVRDGYAWFGAIAPNVSVVVATGSISASPNPCGVYIGETVCTSRLSWSSSRSDAEVWVTNMDNSGPQLFARAQSGAQYANWIPTGGKRFHLKSGSVTLATVDVYGTQTNEYRPEPEPAPCKTAYCYEP